MSLQPERSGGAQGLGNHWETSEKVKIGWISVLTPCLLVHGGGSMDLLERQNGSSNWVGLLSTFATIFLLRDHTHLHPSPSAVWDWALHPNLQICKDEQVALRVWRPNSQRSHWKFRHSKPWDFWAHLHSLRVWFSNWPFLSFFTATAETEAEDFKSFFVRVWNYLNKLDPDLWSCSCLVSVITTKDWEPSLLYFIHSFDISLPPPLSAQLFIALWLVWFQQSSWNTGNGTLAQTKVASKHEKKNLFHEVFWSCYCKRFQREADRPAALSALRVRWEEGWGALWQC